MNKENVDINVIKRNPLALAVLLDIAYYKKRYVTEITRDLNLKENEKNIFQILDDNGFIRPNPHRQVKDIRYLLAPKGYFLVNELKAENPKLLKEIEPQLFSL